MVSTDFKYADIVVEIKTLIKRGMNPIFVPEYVSYKYPQIHCGVISVDKKKIFVWKTEMSIEHYIYEDV